jgi:hypothetical protein
MMAEANRPFVMEKTLPTQLDSLVKSRKSPLFVILAKARISLFQALMDSGFRRSDGLSDFLRIHQAYAAKQYQRHLHGPQ